MNKFRVPHKVVEAFADECKDLVQIAARLVVKLEKAAGEDRDAKRAELLRTLHNIKGAAAAIGFEDAAHLAHLTESLIAAADPARAMDATLADAVLASVDSIGSHVQQLAKGTLYDEAVKLLTAPVQAIEELVKQAGITPRPFIKAPKVAEKPKAASDAVEADSATVRVRSNQLETVLGATEDLHAAKSRLAARAEEAGRLFRLAQSATRALKRKVQRPDLEPLMQIRHAASKLFHEVTTDAQQLESLAEELTGQMRLLRTVAASSVLDTLERTVRDHAQKRGKEATLAIEGRTVEVDRRVLAALKSPLTHLLRNAVDHGIERPELRKAAGKASAGRVTVSVTIQGELLRVEVEDDGVGVDPKRVRRRAVERGLVKPEEAEALSGTALYDLLFESGFSTADEVTETSGRGVGLDVVRDAMQELRGTVELESQQGQGTRFTLLMPLTVAAIHALVVRVAGQPFAIASQWVKSLGSVSKDAIRVVRGAAYVEDGAQLIPLERLGQVLSMATPPEPYGRRVQVVRLASTARLAAFAVSDYDDEIELVVKPVPPEFHGMKHLAGVAMLGSGKAVLVLEPEELLRAATGRTGLPESTGSNRPMTVLVADDSAATRMLHQSALEAAGFKVLTAANGDEALKLLATSHCDAVVADLRMPVLSGLELARAMKRSERLRHLPVLLCTGQEREEDMRAAAAAGASAFLAKSQWERGLLAEMVRKALMGSNTSLNPTGRSS